MSRVAVVIAPSSLPVEEIACDSKIDGSGIEGFWQEEPLMTMNVQRLFRDAQQLPPSEQLELIQVISQSLSQRFQQSEDSAIPSDVGRTVPVRDLGQLVADFWPEDESADDINSYTMQQRHEDRLTSRISQASRSSRKRDVTVACEYVP
jgi:hypothetical protein